MSTQQYRVNLSIASPAEIERTAQQLTEVREDFLSTGSLTRWIPRPLIFNSWQRCRTLSVNPSRRYAPMAVAHETQLYQLRESNDLLMQAALPVMNYLTDSLADSGYVVVLSDAQGRLLEVAGDAHIRRRLERIDFIAGGDWSEAAAGTNAIGTAISDGHVVQLMAAEHYCDGWQDLTCTAAPIRHPLTNEILGVLDVTGKYRLIRPFLTGFLAAAALEVRQRLHTLLSSPYNNERRQQYAEPVVIFPGESRAIEINMNTSPLQKQNEKIPLNHAFVDDIQSQLHLQERRARDAERLAAAIGMVSASLDVQVTLEKVVEQAAYLLQIGRVLVFLFSEEDGILSTHCLPTQLPLQSETPDHIATLLKNASVTSLIRERGEPVIVDDVLASTLPGASFAEQTGIHSLALLPLVTPRGVNGVIAVTRPIPHHWLIEDIRLGLAFATQAATAIENARLFEVLQQHNRHMEVLNTIVQIINTLSNPSQHLDLVLKSIVEIMHLGAGMLLLLDPSSSQLTLASHYGVIERHLQSASDSSPWETLYTLAQGVVERREPFLLSGNKCDEQTIRDSLHLIGFYNLIAVPLVASNDIQGVLLVGNYTDQSFIEDDLKFFLTIGQQLGLAIKNTQLQRSANEMVALREADQLKSGFLAAVSHDLRSPLTAIRASVESLLDVDGIQSEAGREHLLHNISGQANRLGQLVDQLLDLSRIEAGVLSLDCDWTELSVSIADTVAEFERLHTRCNIERKYDTNLLLCYIDPDRIMQVLWNLLENAYKYAPQGSPIHVETRLTGTEVLIVVADRCAGIPKNEQEKIFQRFYRLPKDQQSHTTGSGLGLAICRGIVEAHGGSIRVEDREEGGCVFIVTLPLSTTCPIEVDTSEEQELLV